MKTVGWAEGVRSRLGIAALALVIVCVAGLQFSARSTAAAGGLQAKIPISKGIALKLPGVSAAAQKPVSGLVAAHDPAYQIRHLSSGAVTAVNPAQHLRASFTSAGVVLRSGTQRLTLGLAGARRAVPTIEANRVSYRYGAVTQSLTNAPSGLEQRFVVAKPEGGNRLTLSLATTGTATPELTPNGIVSFGGRGHLSYGDLIATDHSGRRLAAKLAVAGGRVRITVDTRGASYPLTIDPTIFQTLGLVGSDGANGSFGTSVAMYGTTLVVGDPGINGGEGSVSVYTEAAGGWANNDPLVPTATLTIASRYANGTDAFGSSVAIDGTGPGDETIVVGADAGNSGSGIANGDGAAFVFTEPVGGWQTATNTIPPLTVPNPSGGDDFGNSVGISGTTVVVGADEAGNSANGAAFVYTGLTTPIANNPLGDGGTGSDEFGTSVAVSNSAVVVGAPGADNGAAGLASGNGDGAAFVFSLTGAPVATGTSGNALPIPSAYGGDGFGQSVAISGSTIAVGAFTGGSNSQGLAFVYPTATSQSPATLSAPDGSAGDDFGQSIAISGSTVVVGADQYDDSGNGLAYSFATSGGAPTAEMADNPGTSDDEFGQSVGLSAAGIAAGGGNNSPGEADVFAPQLSVTLNGSGSVTSSDQTINCGLTCSATYLPGSTVDLTASGLGNSVFYSWNGACQGVTTPSCTVTLSGSAPTTVTANFGAPGALSASISSPSSSGTYAVGQSVPTSFTCTQGADAPAISSCTDSNGATGSSTGSGSSTFAGTGALNTSVPGSYIYSVTPADANTSYPAASITYTVVGPPSNQAAPAITGTDTVGSPLSCSEGQWSGAPTGYAYIWEQNGTPISGATSATYTLATTDAGTTVTCVVTASNAAAGATAASAGLAVPAAVAPTTTPPTPTTPTTTTPTPTPTVKVTLTLSIGAVVDQGTRLQFTCSSPGHVVSTCTVTARSGHTVVATGGARGNGQKLRVILKLTSAGLARALANPAGLRITVDASGAVKGSSTLKRSETAILSFSRQVLIPANGMFAPNTAQLTSYGTAFLAATARHIGRSERVICVGYTAAPGGSLTNDPFSLSLSRQRAATACRYLRSRHVSATYETEGLGKRDPLVPNTTQANLARNRRVEFEVADKLLIKG